MIAPRFRSRLLFTSLLAGVAVIGSLSATAHAQQVADSTLSDIRVDNVGGCASLTVAFNVRLQVLSHFPESDGRELHIRVRSIDEAISQSRESLRSPESVPDLASVQFEGDNPAGPVLSLLFNRDMHFEVQAGDRPQTIVIRLSHPGGTCTAVPNIGETSSVVHRNGALPAIPVPSGLYILNLVSQTNPLDNLAPAQTQALAGKIVYENDFERDSQHWHRLRLGFFETLEQANAAKAKLAATFPDAWAIRVSPEERAAGVGNRRDTGPVGGTGIAAMAAPGSEADKAETARLTTEAEAAIKAGELDRAVQLLTNGTALPPTAATPRALELLGLTRERKGQAAHAQAAYEDYLQRFPSGDGADRVRQRLAALTSASTGGQQLHAASSGVAGKPKTWVWGSRGSFSQFYFRDQTSTSFTDASRQLPNPDTNSSVNLNQLLTSADVTITGGNDRQQLQIRAAGSYAKSLGTPFSSTSGGSGQTTSGSGSGKDVKSLTALYLDYADREDGISTRLGRQTRNSDGVLGRFDGALVSWQAEPKLRFNLVGGFPVLNSHQFSILDKRWFYGASADFGGRRSMFQTTLYWFDQHSAGGFVDRRSVGIEERFLKRNFNAYLMLDYDVHYNTVNLGLLTLNYVLPDRSTIALTADYRRSPLLTTNNALIGMIDNANLPIMQLAGLKPFFTDAQIYDAAKGNTLITKSITATYSRPITKKLQVNIDFTATNTGGTTGTPATSGTQAVIAMPATGKEYYWGTQLVGSGLLWDNDIYILSGRYADTYGGRLYTADFNARLPLSTQVRLSPRLRYGYRKDKLDVGSLTQFQPTMQLNYYPRRHAEVELEFGGDFSTQKQIVSNALTTTKNKGFLLTAGYRLDF